MWLDYLAILSLWATSSTATNHSNHSAPSAIRGHSLGFPPSTRAHGPSSQGARRWLDAHGRCGRGSTDLCTPNAAFQWTLPILEFRPSDASETAKRCFKSQDWSARLSLIDVRALSRVDRYSSTNGAPCEWLVLSSIAATTAKNSGGGTICATTRCASSVSARTTAGVPRS
jgi:hypothetical protein